MQIQKVKRAGTWRALVASVLLFGGCVLVQAADTATANDAAIARKLMDAGNLVEALPYYARLAQQEPQNALYAERHAVCLMTQLHDLPAGEARSALVARARAEAERAKSLGDNSNLLGIVLEYLQSGLAETPSQEDRELAAGEAAFARGEYDKALVAYESAAASNPLSYRARLFAGDVHFVKGNLQGASKWFQAAIDLNPNIETAHRYWGDTLAKFKLEEEALTHYINALIAEPYSRAAQVGLQQWAARNRVKLVRPLVPVPPAPTVVIQENGQPKVTINITPDVLKSKNVGAAWLVYAAARSTAMTAALTRPEPQVRDYRHSLVEEARALGMALSTAQENKLDLEGADKDLRDLVRLGKAGMIEPFILLNAADEGIAQDYAEYRQANREKLANYIRQFMLARE